MKVTIYDVAKETGLSIATVSRAINGKGRVSAETVRRVKETIDRLGYIPDANAKGLASSLVNTVGIVIGPSITTSYAILFLEGARDAAEKYGFDLLLMSLQLDPEEFAKNVLTRHRIDGLLFAGATEYIRPLFDQNFPLVYAGKKYMWDDKDLSVYGGFSAYRKAALKLLYEKGCRRLLFVEGGYSDKDAFYQDADFYNREVVENTLKELGENSCQIEYVYPLNIAEAEKVISKALSRAERPDGIFITSEIVYPRICAAAGQMGIRIPEDLKVIAATQNAQDGALYKPALTAFALDSYQMGYQGMEKLIRQIYGRPIDDIPSNIPYIFIDRKSV